MKKSIILVIITIITAMISFYFVGIFFGYSIEIENISRNVFRILVVAFFTLCVATPILITIRNKNKKIINIYNIMITIILTVIILGFWGFKIIKYEEKINDMKKYEYVYDETKREQNNNIINILEQNKNDTYKEYIIKGLIEIFIMTLSIVVVQRNILISNKFLKEKSRIE